MSLASVTVVINQQQAQMLDRLIAEGHHGATYGEVIRSGFVRFCQEHPEVSERPAGTGDGGGPMAERGSGGLSDG